MSIAMSNRWITKKGAKFFALCAALVSLALAIVRTFFDQDLFAALVGVSSAAIFYWTYRNPEVLVSRSWDEYCKNYDNSRDKKYLKGFPLYQLLILSVIPYIWLT